MLHLQESIRSGRFAAQYDSERRAYEIWGQMSEKERLAALEGGKFTGMVQGEDLENSSLYVETTKQEMVNALSDELYNAVEGYDVEDTNHYIFKLKGRAAPVYSADYGKKLTKAVARDIEWISGDQRLSNYRFYAKDEKAKRQMMQHMGFHEFSRGHDLSGYFSDRHYSYEEQFWHD